MRKTAFLLIGLALPLGALAQAFPSKPIRFVVPFPPGGIDRVARIMAPKMTDLLGQPIVVENRAGASGTIGAQIVTKSEPDGHTLLFASSGTLVTGIFLFKNSPLHPIRDFTPISKLWDAYQVLSVHASVPANSLAELLALAKKSPGKLSYGSSGIGSVFHLDGEMLKQIAGIDVLHVPYKGTAPLQTDLVAGRVEIGFQSLSQIMPQIQSGKFKLLAVLERKRNPHLPDVPSMNETLPGWVKPPVWQGLFGPPELPRPIVSRLHAAIVHAVNHPEVRAATAKIYTDLIGGTPEELMAELKADLEATEKLVKAIGIQPE